MSRLDSNTMAKLIQCQVMLDELALGLIRLQQVSGFAHGSGPSKPTPDTGARQIES